MSGDRDVFCETLCHEGFQRDEKPIRPETFGLESALGKISFVLLNVR